ncbi:hypothetical protein [Amycolatopsis minnesotensis]|uniref:Secreted protein n=1 Tax=Amycolatopsis minnesotensis TaxID=337894 RepID=A0ABP5BZM9_9PSEU
MPGIRAVLSVSTLIAACGVAVAGPAAATATDSADSADSAGSGDCRDWWTIDDTARTVFTERDRSVKFWGHRSCGATRTPEFWSAPYRPDEPGDFSWEQMKAVHGNDPGAVAYGFELRARGAGWTAVGFAASHG